MTDMLALQGLQASYGAAQVIDDVSFVVRKGAVTALLGRNGAGKSSTFKAIVGLIERKGSVRFLGHEIGAEPTYRIARSGLGYVPEDRRIFTELTVEENLGGRPAAAAQRRSTLDAGENLRALPEPGRDASQGGRSDERGRTADADHRADADGQPPPPHAG